LRHFDEHHDELLAIHDPKGAARKVLLQKNRGDAFIKGMLGWVIEQYTSDNNRDWTKLAESSKAVYRRHFDWLREKYGDLYLAAFDRDMVKAIRNERKAQGPSIANMTVDKLGQLWNWADENCNLTGIAKLPPVNPTTGVASVDQQSKSAPAWPEPLCAAMEGHHHRRMVTFYYLARYTGQRRSDCCEMEWTDYNEVTGKIYVVQEKTNTKVWVPAHKRLREYLASLKREGKTILAKADGSKYAWTSITNTIIKITRDDLKFVDEDNDVYSPHGLRHLCGRRWRRPAARCRRS